MTSASITNLGGGNAILAKACADAVTLAAQRFEAALETLTRNLASELAVPDLFKAIIDARNRAKQQADSAVTPAWKQEYEDQERILNGLLDPAELFARSYAQYVAWRSGDQTMLGQIDLILGQRYEIERIRQWPYADFLPLIHWFDTLFEEQGWLTRTKL